MKRSHQRVLLLLLLYAGNGRIQGITRLQKILYLLKRDYNIDKVFDSSYDFEAYRFGPYSKQLYDDIDFLENMGLIKGQAVGDPSLASEGEEKLLLIDYLLASGEETTNSGERLFTLTSSGKKKAEDILKKLKSAGTNTSELMSLLAKVKSKFAEMNLSSLIHYVYRKYPESAINSELKHLL